MNKNSALRLSVLGLLLCFVQQMAHADLWAHVDERGVTHFAAEQVDARYQLFFRGNDFDSTRDAPANASPMPYALPAAGARLLERGIAQRASDIDFALVAGLGFPRWQGGPMFWADQRGLLILRRDLAEWGQEAPEIWAMAPLIADLAAQGGHFADHAAQAGSSQKDA